jgi:hypothetical protein
MGAEEMTIAVRNMMRRIFQTLFLGTTTMLAVGQAQAQAPAAPPPLNVLEQSSEYRFQLDLHVNDAALAGMLPAGWESAAATQGGAKDANLRLIFVDCVNIVGPDNKVLGKGANRIAMLAAPVKKSDGSATGQMILGGISEDANVPDSYGVYLKSATAKMSRSASVMNGAATETDDWDFSAAGGEHLQMHLKFTPGPVNRGGGDTRFYNPADPSQFQIARTQQVTDVARNVTTTPPDRVLEFSLKAGGGKFAGLLDGARPLSWDSQPVYMRIVGTP